MCTSRSLPLEPDRLDRIAGYPSSKIPGEEVFRRMREKNAAVKVVIASGYLAANTKAELTVAGVKHFVNKPYSLNELEVFQNVIAR